MFMIELKLEGKKKEVAYASDEELVEEIIARLSEGEVIKELYVWKLVEYQFDRGREKV